MRTILLYSGGLVFLLSGVMQSCMVRGSQSSEMVHADATPAILFLSCSIWKDSGQVVRVELIKKILRQGIIKSTSGKITSQPGDLKCTALDASKQPLHTIYIPNPLHKTVEYEDETGHLARKEVWLEKAEFSVRMQLPVNAKFVAIERIDTTGNLTLLTTEIY